MSGIHPGFRDEERSNTVDSTHIGIAGEFYVLAQLSHRGLVASFTLANTKAVDILVFDESLSHFCKVEVKTTQRAPRREKLFADPRLVYCFVVLRGTNALPLFFIVPSPYVADYVREQHRYWIRTRTQATNATNMRQFRIRTSDPLGFMDNWSILSSQSPPEHQVKLTETWHPG